MRGESQESSSETGHEFCVRAGLVPCLYALGRLHKSRGDFRGSESAARVEFSPKPVA